MPVPIVPILLASAILDAHNCYPEKGRFAERIERALRTGTPVAIEQDLAWHRGRSVLAHHKETDGSEPGMREYFFERVRPVVERELREGSRGAWPVIVLNLDFKTDEPEHHRAVWQLLGEYESWLSTAPRTATPARPERIDWKPILVLTGVNDDQEKVFHDAVPAGARLRLFGAARNGARAGNYRRWSNNPWSVIENGGQNKAGEWTAQDDARLKDVVKTAHRAGLWIRFYTLNGHDAAAGEQNGWTKSYNFGSLDAARLRWKAALQAGVDFIATDQYEEFASEASRTRRGSARLRRK